MKKLGIRILVLFVILFVTILAGGRFDNIDKEHNNDPNIIRVAAAKHFDSLDILFIGSSASYSGIDPSYFDSLGLHTYNLGIAAAGPYFYELLINDYLQSVKRKPRTIFIQLLPNTFMNETDDFSNFGIHRYLVYPISNEQIARQYSLWFSYPSLLLKSFQKGVKNILAKGSVSNTVTQQTIAGKGFYPSDEVTSAAKEQTEARSNSKWKRESFNTVKFNYLVRYIDSIKKQGIEVVLFSVPSNKLPAFFNSDYLHNYQEAVAGLSKQNIFLDLSAQQLDSSCYRNSDHLNTHGASLVTKNLLENISANPHLKELYHLSIQN